MSRRLGHPRAWLALALTVLWLGAAGATSAPPLPAPPGAPDVQPPDASRAWMFRRLGEADQLLRQGRPRAAARAFREVFVAAEGTPWGTLAELGMAWSVAAGGDLAMARALAADAHAAGGSVASTTSVVFGLLSARAGDHAAALARLDDAGRSASATEANVIRLTKAYVLFWSGELARAATEFDAVAAADPHAGIADDARYGAAWSRWKLGESARARSDLDDLIHDAPQGFEFRSVPRRLIELDERAILGDSTRRYRRGGIQAPDAQLTRLLDSDGYSRAHAALRMLDAGPDATLHPARNAAPALPAELASAGHAPVGRAPEATAPKAAAATSGERAVPSRSRSVYAIVVLLVLLALAVAVTLTRRQRLDAVPKRR